MTDMILYHALCLTVLFLTYIGSKGSKKEGAGCFRAVYLATAIIIVSDCLWGILSATGSASETVLYLINIVYFLGTILGVYSWALFTIETINGKLRRNRLLMTLFLIPALFASVLTVLTPFNRQVFYIENGNYVRGNLFFIDAVIKLLYLTFSSVYAFICYKKEGRRYLRKKYGLLALYGIPVIVAGAFQSVFGIDLNCVAPVIGLSVVYKFGLHNDLKDNGDLVKAIAKAYVAVFVVDTDDGIVRSVASLDEYAEESKASDGLRYDEFLMRGIRYEVMPEDRITVEKKFAFENVLRQLETKSSYSFVYKVFTQKGQTGFKKATFMKAFSDEDRHEIFLGIEKMEIRQMLLREKEELEAEREEFERIKEQFTSVIASIIEARDVDSGEHVMRVKDITQCLCNQVMADYPEYGLTPLKIRYIVNGSALHDIGKIMIPDAILLKPGQLTEEEYELMKTHCEKGCTIIEKLPADMDSEYIRYAMEICRWHHERYDGDGYPDGLKGDEIPISAQIVSLADCFDALTAKRSYKGAMSVDEAVSMIAAGKCGSFNSRVLECLKKVAADF